MSNETITPEKARELLWRRANLEFLLDQNQKDLFDIYKNTKERVIVWTLARSSGKSRTLCVIAITECLKNDKALVKYCCAKQNDAQRIIQPLMREILETCPEELKPQYIVSEKAYKFPNGAQIQLSGLDNGRSESLRGGSSVLCIVDEAGERSLGKKTDGLDYIVKSILIPSVIRSKEIDGKVILASTPPLKFEHPYIGFMRRAEAKGVHTIRTVFQNPRMTAQMIGDIIEECGGINSPTFRREYLCEILRSEDEAVIPEFTKLVQDAVIKEWTRPPFLDFYVSMDLGMKDLTVALFAYYDFKADKVIIEDEVVMNGQKFTTDFLASEIKRKECELFINPNTLEIRSPLKRVSDNNLIVINDLHMLHSLLFIPTRKDDKDAALNNLRIMIAAEKIIINPRCKTLIAHLRDATWNKGKTTYERSFDNGHYDAVDAASYLIRNIDFSHNPYPAGYSGYKDFYPAGTQKPTSNYGNAIKQMCGINRPTNKRSVLSAYDILCSKHLKKN
jgi:hypothetical protein